MSRKQKKQIKCDVSMCLYAYRLVSEMLPMSIDDDVGGDSKLES